MMFSEWKWPDRLKLDGKTVTFEVLRDGEWSPRYGAISRMKPHTFFVGSACYSVSAVRNVEAVE